MAFDFTGKNIIVSGGAMGIGRAVVEGVVHGGGSAIIVDINLDAAKKTASELGDRVSAYKMDLGNPAEIREVIAKIISDKGRVHGVVNNGGMLSKCTFEELSQEEWEKVIQVNLTGCFTVISALFPHMRESGGGRIVNVSSVASKVGGGLLGTAAYASSKAGINGLTKAIAKEGGKYGIYCNVVCPAYTRTAMTSTLQEDKAKEANTLNAIPLRRSADPSEIANMILFFMSDLASFVTGEIGDCDGGLTLDG
ncbi:SDR family oxidoreductase [Christensenellaceae bacterium OttesenSCG-928-M15]|nr:SDR family oxidoreductase [Christensenellaceae bacterium OttesenSCG-928-M15]